MPIAIQYNSKYFIIADDLQTVVEECDSVAFNEACACAGEPLVSTDVELPAVLVEELDKRAPNMQRLGDWEISYFDEHNNLREKTVVFERWGMWLEDWASEHCKRNMHYARFEITLLKEW